MEHFETEALITAIDGCVPSSIDVNPAWAEANRDSLRTMADSLKSMKESLATIAWCMQNP